MLLEFIFKIRGISNQVIYLLIYFLLELSLKLLVTITIAEVTFFATNIIKNQMQNHMVYSLHSFFIILWQWHETLNYISLIVASLFNHLTRYTRKAISFTPVFIF
jgi:hypothetical protein